MTMLPLATTMRLSDVRYRRNFLFTLGGIVVATAFSPGAAALGRTPLGGRLIFRVPWPTNRIDPHDLKDPTAALFGHAIADPIYAFDTAGVPYPSLAAGMPIREEAQTIVRLREGLRSSRGASLDAHDLVASIERARLRGAAAVLVSVPKPVVHRREPLAAVFGATDPAQLARALASPVVALLPRRYDPTRPDGTGAFAANVVGGRLVLTRNLFAARGAAFLDAIEVSPAEDLKASLRAFEAEQDDLGWLGLGFHSPRASATRFDLGRVRG